MEIEPVITKKNDTPGVEKHVFKSCTTTPRYGSNKSDSRMRFNNLSKVEIQILNEEESEKNDITKGT